MCHEVKWSYVLLIHLANPIKITSSRNLGKCKFIYGQICKICGQFPRTTVKIYKEMPLPNMSPTISTTERRASYLHSALSAIRHSFKCPDRKERSTLGTDSTMGGPRIDIFSLPIQVRIMTYEYVLVNSGKLRSPLYIETGGMAERSRVLSRVPSERPQHPITLYRNDRY